MISTCSSRTDQNKHEMKQHGTPAFPVACYCDNLKTETVDWHWHEELEAGYVTAGECVLATSSGSRILQKGDVFFLRPASLHACFDVPNNPLSEIHSLVFHPRFIGGYANSIFDQLYIRPFTASTSPEQMILAAVNHPQEKTALETAWKACEEEPLGYEMIVRDALTKFLAGIVMLLPSRSVPQGISHSYKEERLKQMLQYIDEHISEELNLLQIAASASVSESECLRCFHSVMQTTPISYVKQHRISLAAEMLSHSDLSVGEVGERCGFMGMSYFAKTFFEIKGVTPGKWRKNNSSN